MMQLEDSDRLAPIVLSLEEREAIARSKAAADRGKFATDEQVRAVWAAARNKSRHLPNRATKRP